VAYEDRIIELHEKYARKGVPVIAINPNDDEKSPNDSFAKMQERSKEKGFPFPYVYDETQEITKAYGATNTPHVYVLDATKTVKYIGAIDNNTKSAEDANKKYVEDAVDAVLNGVEVPEKKTKAIGCTIKWAS
jgi:alkyl hydroperoxide reductase subunit AhpC